MAGQQTANQPAMPLPLQSGWPTHIFILCIVMPILATLAVFGRFVAKGRTRVRFQLDDALIVAALIVHYGQITCGILTVILGGTGRDSKTINAEAVLTAGKVLVGVLYLWVLSLALAKLSVCVMLLNIFGHNKPFRITIYLTVGLIISWTVMNFFMAVLNCSPVSYAWDKSIPGTCDNVEATFLVTTILDIGVDLILAIAPLPFIWRLKQTTRVKVALTLLFSLTLFDMVLGVIRGWARVEGSIAGSWTAPGFCSTLSWFVGLMEPGVAIIIACAILMRPLLDVITPGEWILMAIRPLSKGYRSTRKSSEGPSRDSEDSAAHALRPSHRRTERSEKDLLTYSPAHIDLTFERTSSTDSRMKEAMHTCPNKILVRKEVIVK